MNHWEVSVMEHEYLLGIGCTEITCNLASCNNFTRNYNLLARSDTKNTFLQNSY